MSDVTAIIGVHDEEETVANALNQLNRSGVDAIVVIENGSADCSYVAIQTAASRLRCPLYVERFDHPLGHDVARAIGTYKALRIRQKNSLLVYVDSDWGGSFGPNLEMFIERAKRADADIYSVSWRAVSSNWKDSISGKLWMSALAQQTIVPSNAVPCLLPIAIRGKLFHALSPSLLAHPGLWFAASVRANCIWQADDEWSLDMVGHRTRSTEHARLMETLLASDAEEAIAQLATRNHPTSILSIVRPELVKARQNDCSLPTRDVQTLLRYASAAHFKD